MILAFFTVLLVILFLFPFVAGMRELQNKSDISPLYINMGYAKDPRYFGQSFRNSFLRALGANGTNGIHFILMSKQEAAEVVDTGTVGAGEVTNTIYYVKEDLTSKNGAYFQKEVYVRGNAAIGENNSLRALACDGDVHLSRGTEFVRWLDSEGTIVADSHCGLGVSAACGGEFRLARGCSFKRLYGFPVNTGAESALAPRENIPESFPEYSPARSIEASYREAAPTVAETRSRRHYDRDYDRDYSRPVRGATDIDYDVKTVRHHSQVDCSIVTVHSLTIEKQALVRGHVKTYGNLDVGAGVTICGNVFAEGDVHLGPGSQVHGTVFTQGHVLLDEGVTVGSADKIKSVVGKKGVEIRRSVKVYGYVMTEGEGTVA
jgi:NDP-sugar pyrophosphorylase family protein